MAWIYVIPRFRGYKICQEVITLDNGAQTHALVKIPLTELAEWEATHDATGRSFNTDSGSDTKARHGYVVDDGKA